MREAILRELVEEVMAVAGEGYEVHSNLVKKNNGVELQAVVIRTKGEVVSPTIYVDQFIDEIEKEEVTVTEVAEKVFEIYKENKNPELGAEVSDFTKKQYILDHVEYQLVNADRNASRLEKVPSKKIADLAALYRTVISNDQHGTASFVVTDEMMELAGISIEELDEAATRNTKNAGFSVKSMQQVMAEMMGMSEEMAEAMADGPQMFVLTNGRKTNGANILLFKEQLAELAEKVDDDFFILPSSIHELLAIPASQVDEAEQLRQMVREVNDTQVAPDEILGYEVYRYNRETGEVEVAA